MSGKPPISPKRHLRTLDDVPVDGKRVLVKVDFNVAVGSDGKVDQYEDYRIESALNTINELRQRRAKVLLLTHLGRPQQEHVEQLDLQPIRRRLEELLGEEVRLLKTLYGTEVDTVTTSLDAGSVMLLPNVRLDSREEIPNDKFAQELASTADVYVNEAFSVSHRAHTSLALVPKLLPSCAGRRTVEEVTVLQKLRENPAHPYVAIASGSKISDKVGMLRDLLQKVDMLCLGGQLANVFLAAQGLYKNHPYTEEELRVATELLSQSAKKILIPTDIVIGPPSNPGESAQTVASNTIPSDAEYLCDIGEQSVKGILAACENAKTIMWNGPVGKFEEPVYAKSTYALAQGLATLPAYRIVGGGDTVVALEKQKLISKFDHVSVGGGALVQFIEGKTMPALEPLYNK